MHAMAFKHSLRYAITWCLHRGLINTHKGNRFVCNSNLQCRKVPFNRQGNKASNPMSHGQLRLHLRDLRLHFASSTVKCKHHSHQVPFNIGVFTAAYPNGARLHRQTGTPLIIVRCLLTADDPFPHSPVINLHDTNDINSRLFLLGTFCVTHVTLLIHLLHVDMHKPASLNPIINV